MEQETNHKTPVTYCIRIRRSYKSPIDEEFEPLQEAVDNVSAGAQKIFTVRTLTGMS